VHIQMGNWKKTSWGCYS